MPIEFRSGLPGSGKTLGAVHHMLELRRKEPDRPVYALGINELRDTLAHIIDAEQLRDWQQLPPKSIIIVDECQKYLPARRSGDPPQWIKDLSTHRHLGLDFILISQHPALIDNYVRRLVDRHIHHVRKFGTEFSDRWEWQEIQPEPTSASARKNAVEKTLWKFPKEAMDAYKSAEVHTVKRRIPRALWVTLVGAIAAPLLLWFGFHHIGSMTKQPDAKSADAKPAFTAQASPAPKGPKSREQWIEERIPRVAGIPWSAPIYDDEKVQAQPDLYCASWIKDEATHTEDCHCYTEQGTRAEVPGKLCLSVAKGGIYNPYRRPLGDRQPAAVAASAATGQQPLPVGAPAAQASAPSTSWPAGVGAQSYTPPAAPGSWNPNAFAGGPPAS
jgi:zona occludens toxin